MRFQLKESAWLTLSNGASQVYPAGAVFGDAPGDLPIPSGWLTADGIPPYVIGLDSAAQTLVKNANRDFRGNLQGQGALGPGRGTDSVPGIGHVNNLN